MPNKQDFPRLIASILRIEEREDWYSTEGKVRAEFGNDVGPLLGVARGGLNKVTHMKAILESVGVTWDRERHSSENASKPGGNVRKEAYEDLFYALQAALAPEDATAAEADAGALANEFVQRLVRLRRGQSAFRDELVRAYEGKCAISGSGVLAVLDAAHITPFSEGGAQELTNGLLLRKDIHALFDSGLISIDGASWTVLVSESLNGTDYENYRGQAVLLPGPVGQRPNQQAVDDHRVRSGL